jgi:plastocyanin
MKSILSLVFLGASVAQAANHVVTVGVGGVVYTPDSVTAAVGDTVEFQFETGVSQASLNGTTKFVRTRIPLRKRNLGLLAVL